MRHRWEELRVRTSGVPDVYYVNRGPDVRGDGGGSGGEQSSSGAWGSMSLAPIQLGAKTPLKALGDKNYEELVKGIYSYIKAYTQQSAEIFKPQHAAETMRDIAFKGIQEWEDKSGRVADMLAEAFGKAIKPDELKTFPLDSFIQKNIKDIYSKAESAWNGALDLDRNAIKTIVDANTSQLISGFRQQRRALQQGLAAKGIDPSSPQGQAQLQQLETDISRGKEDVARGILAQELAARPERKMQALSQMQGAVGQAKEYVGQQSQRWLDQWKTKIGADELRVRGLTTALQGYGQAANIEGAQYNMLSQNMNAPMGYVQQGLGFLSEVGRQDIAAHSGSSTSWGSQQSSGSQWGPSGSFGLPFGIWNQTY